MSNVDYVTIDSIWVFILVLIVGFYFFNIREND